jgi:hypothetical protein
LGEASLRVLRNLLEVGQSYAGLVEPRTAEEITAFADKILAFAREVRTFTIKKVTHSSAGSPSICVLFSSHCHNRSQHYDHGRSHSHSYSHSPATAISTTTATATITVTTTVTFTAATTGVHDILLQSYGGDEDLKSQHWSLSVSRAAAAKIRRITQRASAGELCSRLSRRIRQYSMHFTSKLSQSGFLMSWSISTRSRICQ